MDKLKIRHLTNCYEMCKITWRIEVYINAILFQKYVGRKTEKVVTKALGFGNQGVVTLFAQTDRGAYCSGEKIYIKCEYVCLKTAIFCYLTLETK
jgi:hypothetical protein